MKCLSNLKLGNTENFKIKNSKIQKLQSSCRGFKHIKSNTFILFAIITPPNAPFFFLAKLTDNKLSAHHYGQRAHSLPPPFFSRDHLLYS